MLQIHFCNWFREYTVLTEHKLVVSKIDRPIFRDDHTNILCIRSVCISIHNGYIKR